jgi:hypothetical protein
MSKSVAGGEMVGVGPWGESDLDGCVVRVGVVS